MSVCVCVCVCVNVFLCFRSNRMPLHSKPLIRINTPYTPADNHTTFSSLFFGIGQGDGPGNDERHRTPRIPPPARSRPRRKGAQLNGVVSRREM